MHAGGDNRLAELARRRDVDALLARPATALPSRRRARARARDPPRPRRAAHTTGAPDARDEPRPAPGARALGTQLRIAHRPCGRHGQRRAAASALEGARLRIRRGRNGDPPAAARQSAPETLPRPGHRPRPEQDGLQQRGSCGRREAARTCGRRASSSAATSARTATRPSTTPRRTTEPPTRRSARTSTTSSSTSRARTPQASATCRPRRRCSRSSRPSAPRGSGSGSRLSPSS